MKYNGGKKNQLRLIDCIHECVRKIKHKNKSFSCVANAYGYEKNNSKIHALYIQRSWNIESKNYKPRK